MKQLLATLALMILCCAAFAQRRTTTVKSYYRKDGTYVPSHTRHYNAGSGSRTSSAYSSYSPGTASTSYASDAPEIVTSTLAVATKSGTGGYQKVCGVKVVPTTLHADTNGVSVLVAVLRYNDTAVLDISPLTKSIINYDYETTSTSLFFKIRKDKLREGQVIQLVSNFGFYINGEFLTKSVYLGIGKVDLPSYLSLKVEALTLK